MRMLRDEFPDPDAKPHDAAEWIRAKIIGALGQAKLWPVRLAAVRHQEKLSPLILMEYVLWYASGLFACSQSIGPCITCAPQTQEL